MRTFLLAVMAVISIAAFPSAFAAGIDKPDPVAFEINRIGDGSETLWASDAVVQWDGKIVVAGSSSDSHHAHTMLLLRLHANGRIDDPGSGAETA